MDSPPVDIKYIVELTNVYVRSGRGQDVFNDLNFRLEAGRTALIIGAAGSGKSTLIELLIGRRFVSGGAVELFGNLLKPGKKKLIKRTRRKIGGVGGVFTLMPSYTVAENITFPLVLAGEKKRIQKERLLKMLTEFSLVNYGNELPQNLTRVENTLVQFARASVAFQPLILIDEPLAGLDHKTYQRLYDFLVRIALSGRSMIILSSEPLKSDLPNTDTYSLVNGVLT